MPTQECPSALSTCHLTPTFVATPPDPLAIPLVAHRWKMHTCQNRIVGLVLGSTVGIPDYLPCVRTFPDRDHHPAHPSRASNDPKRSPRGRGQVLGSTIGFTPDFRGPVDPERDPHVDQDSTSAGRRMFCLVHTFQQVTAGGHDHHTPYMTGSEFGLFGLFRFTRNLDTYRVFSWI